MEASHSVPAWDRGAAWSGQGPVGLAQPAHLVRPHLQKITTVRQGWLIRSMKSFGRAPLPPSPGAAILLLPLHTEVDAPGGRSLQLVARSCRAVSTGLSCFRSAESSSPNGSWGCRTGFHRCLVSKHSSEDRSQLVSTTWNAGLDSSTTNLT